MTTGLFNRHSQAVIEALTSGSKKHVTEAEVTAITGLQARLIEPTLSSAVELGALCRRRIGKDLAYVLPEPPAASVDPRSIAEHTKATTSLANSIEQQAEPVRKAIETLTTSQPKPQHKPRGGRMAELPAVDISALKVTYAPPADGRQNTIRKWDSLFDTLAAKPIKQGPDGPELPTIELGREYHGALQQAARDWQARRKDKARFKVSTAAGKTLVQRAA